MSYAKLALIAGITILAGCSSQKTEAPVESAPVRVSTARAEVRRISSERIISGTVSAKATVAVSTRLPGHIRELRVREGDNVQTGQIIALIDARDSEAAIRQAESARDEARAAVPEAEANIAAASAQAALAKTTLQRMTDLHNNRSVTGQEFDESQARARAAEAQVQLAQARLAQARERIRQTDDALARAQLQQSYTVVTAPFAGVVLERRAEPGTFANPGMPIVMLEKAGEFRVEAQIEESLLKEIRPGRSIGVEIEASGETRQLPVTDILPALNAQSRSATVRIDLPRLSGLRTGMSARLRLPGGERDAILVVTAAVRRHGQLATVFTVNGGRARAAMVSLGETEGGSVEIISGLSGNESVVLLPPSQLADGARVEVTQ